MSQFFKVNDSFIIIEHLLESFAQIETNKVKTIDFREIKNTQTETESQDNFDIEEYLNCGEDFFKNQNITLCVIDGTFTFFKNFKN